MKKEELFDGFGALDEELLRRSEQGGSTMKKRNNMSKIIKFGSLAACLAVVLGVGGFWMDSSRTPDSDTVPEHNIVTESNDNVSGEPDSMQEEPERYVEVAMLLASNEGVEEQLLAFKLAEIEEYSAIYYKVESVDSSILKESTGSKVEGTQNWYKVSGHEDMQYLIYDDNGEYSLWIFNSFQSESYAYNDVLQLIYNIDSAEDITEIIVAPATMDNTDEGKAIQNEIGTTTIADDEDINILYDVLSELTCYGSDHWDMIGLGGDSPSAMQEQVRAGRYLTLITSQGMKIDTLKYTGISGMFYEYSGIAYSALTLEEKSAIEEILNIELLEESGETGNAEAATGNAVSDAPIDEENYHEAREYAEELIDLQNRISEAMVNKELPFVTVSAIRENPDRLHIVVTTTDEELIARLKAFDTTGELLEIEYSENVVEVDLLPAVKME